MNTHPQIIRSLILTVLCLCGSYAAAQQQIAYTLDHYFQHVGREGFFNGRLLTADDFSDEQQYRRPKEMYLGDTEVPLDEIFAPLGMRSVTLFFDEADALFGQAMDPTNSDRPQADDFVLLDDTSGTWRGQLYLPAYAGVYDLEGTFSPVPEPATLGLAALGMAGLGLVALRKKGRPGRNRSELRNSQ